jgi:hypothetical protein
VFPACSRTCRRRRAIAGAHDDADVVAALDEIDATFGKRYPYRYTGIKLAESVE